MRDFAFLWRVLGEPRLARHATSARPAWLWSADGQELIFANPVAAAMAGNGAEPAGRKTDAARPAARQIAQIAHSLPPSGAWRLERLRGLGAGLGRPLTCACQLLALDGAPSVLVAAIEQAGPRLTLAERVRRLFAGSGAAIAAYGAGGELLFATPEAAAHLVVTGPAAESESETLQLGEGDAIVRVRHWPAAASPSAEKSDTAAAAQTATVDLAPIAEAIGEAQKAMAARAAAQPDCVEHPAQSASTPERRHPVRFVWTIDADNRFSIEPGEFTQAIGGKIAAELGRPWVSIAADLGLDPDGEVTRAIASRDTWSGITVAWPTEDGEERLSVELAGLPVYDRERNFRGYRGFGVCRDLARIAALLAARAERRADAAAVASGGKMDAAPTETRPALSVVPAADNVVPFRPSSNDNQGALNPHERNAFQELASRLTERLKNADEVARATAPGAAAPAASPPAAEPSVPAASSEPHIAARGPQPLDKPTKQDRPLLDLLPVGILIYRHEHFFYANRAFLRWSGHDSVQDFAEAGGLDTLFIEPQANDKDQTLRIAAPDETRPPASGHLFSIPWDGSTAMMLVLIDLPRTEDAVAARPAATSPLQAMLDVAGDGVVTFDRHGRILTANAGAARLFGYGGDDLAGLAFERLFAGDCLPLVRGMIARGQAEKLREIAGCTRRGDAVPLGMAFGPLDAAGETFCAVFHDHSRWTAAERELIAARKQAEAASAAKSSFLAKVSHEIRTPLNAIIGFSELMMNERFGPVGTERYKEYLKDIHASGTHVVSLVNDLLDLSKIESGKLDLSFEPVNLNDLTQQSVALMQAEASRERVIIRTSLAAELPQVVADARSVRQMVLNLLSNSIKFTGAGGQVILSTARTDHGEAVLRIRDTGVGMSEKDIATALEPFRQLTTVPKSGTPGTGLGLPLTKALAEANSARFSIKSAVNAGTLVEIVFPAVRAAE